MKLLKKNLKIPTNIKQATDIIASLGGYLNRKNDPPPGHQVFWKGYPAFEYIKYGYMLRMQSDIEGVGFG